MERSEGGERRTGEEKVGVFFSSPSPFPPSSSYHASFPPFPLFYERKAGRENDGLCIHHIRDKHHVYDKGNCRPIEIHRLLLGKRCCSLIVESLSTLERRRLSGRRRQIEKGETAHFSWPEEEEEVALPPRPRLRPPPSGDGRRRRRRKAARAHPLVRPPSSPPFSAPSEEEEEEEEEAGAKSAPRETDGRGRRRGRTRKRVSPRIHPRRPRAKRVSHLAGN